MKTGSWTWRFLEPSSARRSSRKHRRWTRSVRALSLVTLLAGAAPIAAAQAQGEPSREQSAQRTIAERVQRILTDAEADPALSVDVAGRELINLGPEALPPIFDALCASIASSTPSAGPASDRIESVQLFAFHHTPPAQLSTFLEHQAVPDATLDVRRAALRILSEISTARDLGLMLRLADRTPADRGLEQSLEAALDALLARDASTYLALERSYLETATALRRAIVRSVSRAETLDGARLLSRFLYRDDDLRPLLLVSIGRMGRALPRPIGEDVLSNVRRFLAEADPLALPEAILAVGHLDDCESIPQLIALLKSPRRGLRANALWSLKRITGLGIAETPDRWTSWYQSEREWWQDEWPSTLADLHCTNSRRTKVALMDVATRHLGRHALAREVVQVLTHDDIEVATLACSTLAQLESRSAVPGLVDCLGHSDMILRMAAWNALRTITGKDLPLDTTAWSAFASGS